MASNKKSSGKSENQNKNDDPTEPTQTTGVKAEDPEKTKAGANQSIHAEDAPEPDTSTAGSGRNLANVPTSTAPNADNMLKAGEPLDISKITEDADETPVVVIKEDVWEEFYHAGSRRPSHRLVFVKGQVVRKAAIEAFNEARKSQNDSDDEDE